MDKRDEKQEYIKKMLFEKYGEVFEKYDMDKNSNYEICNLAEFLIKEHPGKYARNMKDENNYRRDENLQRIYAVIDKNQNKAVMININGEGKVPKGEFGAYDLQSNKFEMSGKVKEKIAKCTGIEAFSLKKQDEIIQRFFRGTLAEMDKLATMDLKEVIDDKIPEKWMKKILSKEINNRNKENGFSEEDRYKYENADGNKEKYGMPEDVKAGMDKAGVAKVVTYFYVKAKDLGEKVQGTKVNENGEDVLIMEVKEDSKDGGPTRYYAFQDNKMILWGNDDYSVKDVAGDNQRIGQVIEPLRIQQPEYIEYRDSNGLYINVKINDKYDLSEGEIKKYQYSVEEQLEKYSNRINVVLLRDLSIEEKIERLREIDKRCDNGTTRAADKNHIPKKVDETIDKITTGQEGIIEGFVLQRANPKASQEELVL